ncbi:MAG TPA: UTP--glucose-1-phosphate uridylyltransferase [Spirochaetia bacterium]|nr:UTP--glucose-1-phosphate uridylyltransferase [Spirochaetales bacterium]HRY78874.1 UTP--glucose-1-phosphate uridylyltransferase [Spirochaetia bacterium]HRZ88343.1 UTP--glucose-1-phosphate uridylyltransferase [Spirochaetia bacterium]
MKGVIVAAGYGTRFLPVTKTVPKEMLPLLTKPSIAFVVEEFAASGIRDILILTSRRKKALEDFFDRDPELESVFKAEGAAGKLERIAPPAVNVSFVRQPEMRGTGHALLQAAPWLGGDPCVVAYPDDLHFGSPPLARQLMDVYERTGCSVLSGLHEPGDVSRYGVIDPAPDGVHVRGFVEKPAPGTEPSREISLGRYLYTPEFFEILAEGWARHTGGEYYHAYALDRLIAAGKVAWAPVTGTRLDTGDPAGFLDALLRFAWEDPGYRSVLESFIREKTGKPAL